MEFVYKHGSTVIRPADIYGLEMVLSGIQAPIGWDVEAFRPCLKGERILGKNGKVIVARNGTDADQPRLILRKKGKRLVLVGEWDIIPVTGRTPRTNEMREDVAKMLAKDSTQYRIEERD